MNAVQQLFEFVAVSRTNELDDIRDDIARTAEATDDLNAAASDSERASGKAERGLGLMARAANVAKMAMLGLAGVGIAAVVAASGQAFRDFLAFDSAANRLEATTGLTGEALDGLSASAQNLWAGGLGASIDDTYAAIAQVRNITQAEGQELEGLTRQALILSDAFGYDVSESARAVDTAMQQFGTTGQEMFDLITVAAQKTGDPAGDLLDVVNEYSADFAEAGYSADQMIATLVQGSENGVWSLDKMADAVREFGIRTKEGGDEARGAFDALFAAGEEWSFVDYETGARQVIDSTDELYQALADGSIDMALVGDRVAEMWSDIEDPILRNQLGVALMGSQYEELGDAAIEALDIADDALGDVEGATDRAGRALQRGLGPAWERFTRTVRLGLVQAFGPLIERGLNVAVRLLEQLGTWVTTTGLPALRALGGVIGDLAGQFVDFATGIYNTLRGAFETGGFEGLADTLLDALGRGLRDVPGWVKATLIVPILTYLASVNWADVSSKAKELLGKLLAAGAAIGTWVYEDVIQPVVDYLKDVDWADVAGKLAELYLQFLRMEVAVGAWLYEHVIQPVVNYLREVDWSEVTGTLAALFDNFLSWAGRGAASIAEWVSAHVVRPVRDYLKNVNWSDVAGKMGELLGQLLSFAGRGAASVAEWVGANVVTPIVGYLSGVSWVGLATAGINLLVAIARGLVDIAGWVWDNIVAPIANAVVELITSEETYATLASVGGSILSGIAAGFGDIASWVWRKIIQPILGEIAGLPDYIADAIGDAVNPTSGMTAGERALAEAGGTTDSSGGSFVPRLRDAGGPGRANEAYLIGRGAQPELFVPSTAGTFYPAGAYAVSTGGGGNLTIENLILEGIQSPRDLYDALRREAQRRNVRWPGGD